MHFNEFNVVDILVDKIGKKLSKSLILSRNIYLGNYYD